MKQWRNRDAIHTVLAEIVGSLLVAVGIHNFAVYAEFPLTGFSGIALIVYRLTGLSIGVTTLLLNLPVALLCYKVLGGRFLLRSLRSMLIFSVFVDVVAPLLPAYRGDRLLAALCTGALSGVGFGLIYLHNSSTGGLDLITMTIRHYWPHLSMGKLNFAFDMAILLLGSLWLRDVDGLIYGIVLSFLATTVVDRVMYGARAGKLALIVTECAAQIVRDIDRCCGRGATVLPARGGYRSEHKQVVVCACNNREMVQVERVVKHADPQAFMVVLASSEVHGEGFLPMPPPEQE